MNSQEIDKKLEPILRKIEVNGVKIDILYLKKISEEIDKKTQEIKNNIYKLLGYKLNLNSPKQLSDVLYKKLNITIKNKKIKFGKKHLSTDAKSLEKIKSEHPAIEYILIYRELTKIKNTYISPLLKLTDSSDRLHTTYSLDTSTGRLSSKNPNLQNIPIKTTLGKKIRKAFIAKKGYQLLKADYSQIELRVIASLSNDKKMIEIFNKGGDIHEAIAKKINSTRNIAKVVNFGLIYGMSAYGLSETLKIPYEKAQDFIDQYFLVFKDLKEYIDKNIQKAMKFGYVQTMFGKKREIPELYSDLEKVKNFGIRAAINTPVQGTAAEIIKLVMIECSKNNLLQQDEIKLILQVHDELVFEIKKELIKKYSCIIKTTMENIVKLKVPLIVNIKIGKNWQEMENIKI